MTDIQSKANAIKALMNSLIDSSDPEQAAELIRQESTENEAGIYDAYTIKVYTMPLYKLYSEAVSSPLPFNIWIGIMKKELEHKSSKAAQRRSCLITTIERAGFNPNNSR